MHAGTHGCQKRALDPLKMQLQVAVSHPRWVLGNRILQEQQVLLTAEPSPQPPVIIFIPEKKTHRVSKGLSAELTSANSLATG